MVLLPKLTIVSPPKPTLNPKHLTLNFAERRILNLAEGEP